MAMLIENSRLEEELKEQRRTTGADQHDEVWDGTYFMPPMANDDHQEIVAGFMFVLGASVGVPSLGKVRPGVNLAASAEDWERDYRVPDVVVFMADTSAENHNRFWTGPADFIVEITSPRDHTYEKLPFYSQIGVRELLIVNQQSWALELYRHQDGVLQKVAESTLENPELLSSEKLPLKFRLIAGTMRPQIEVQHQITDERWTI
jgi:Uma2 family endonuclease